MTRSYDAIVVGAGPAGAVAAMSLAGAGRSVALLERERLPRYKTCGGGVVERAMAALPCRRPTPDDIPIHPVLRIGVHRNGAQPIVVNRSIPPIHMVMRADFDGFLTARAREAGADLFEGTTVVDVDARNGGYRVRTGEGEFRTTAIVGADGAESRLARFVPGATGPGAARLGVALEGELAPCDPAGTAAAVHPAAPETRFDFTAVPEGYGWVFPKNGHLSAGIFSRRPRFPALRPAYRRYVERVGLGPGLAVEQRLSGHRIPVHPRRVRGLGALLLAGDAAGLADPLTGEGISYAVLSGKMAAEALVRAGNEPARAAVEYEALLANDLLEEIRAARIIADILYLMPRFAFRLFRRQARFSEAVVDVFAGLRSYRGLLRRALSRPWLFIR